MSEEIANVPFEELKEGQTAYIEKVITEKDLQAFAVVSGDTNPIHLDSEYAAKSRFKKKIAHGLFGGSLISAVLGSKLPGPGSIYINQNLNFKKPVYVGDEIKAQVTVLNKNQQNKRVILECKCINQNNDIVIEGQAELIVPEEKYQSSKFHLPEMFLYEKGKRLNEIIKKARSLKGKFHAGVVYPLHEQTINGAILAAENNLITPVFIGHVKKMMKIAELKNYECIDVDTDELAATKAIELMHEGKIDSLLKGDIHTDILMRHVVAKESNLRTERRISHCLFIDTPSYHKPIFLTDAAINILPDLKIKKDIIQNAIDFVHILGIKKPKVALLSAVETVLKNMPSTVDAKKLSEMAENGEITGGIVEGPLAFDLAISKEAALIKKVKSEVVGDADIFVVPNIEAGNILFKTINYLAYGAYAGIVLGAKIPVVLTSRSASAMERAASCALAKIFSLNGDKK